MKTREPSKAVRDLAASLADVNLSALHRQMGESVSLRTLQRIRNCKCIRVSIDTANEIQVALKRLRGQGTAARHDSARSA